ncbi:hypothetical protein J1614_004806 [Plenodomus biglobosus]|nr:hypothetical protein J1614_004806 [Plenodomus biglobosus]
MHDQEFYTLYDECRRNGYSPSEAVARCKEFEDRRLESRKHCDPYNLADMADSLPRVGKGDKNESHYREYYFAYHSTTYKTTERRPTPGVYTPQPRRTGQTRRSERKQREQGHREYAEDREPRERREYRASSRYANGDDYYQEELQSPHMPATELRSPGPRGKYSDSASGNPKYDFTGPTAPSARYHTEERRPQREPSSRGHEHVSFHGKPPRPQRAHSDLPYDNFTHTAAPPPHPSRAYTETPRYNTTERTPGNITRDYYRSGRTSNRPGSSRAAPPPRPRHAESHSSRACPPPQGTVPKVDLYDLLAVSRSATAGEIKKAHRKLCMKWHPDRCAEADKGFATEKMAKINQANDVLSDVKLRKVYDATGCLPGLLD